MSLSRPLGNLQKPQWFIYLKNDKLIVNEGVLSELRTLGRHLMVVTAVGSLRTGKSWILNQLAGCNAKDGFNVADGPTAVTSGIGILCSPHPHKKDCVIVFLDTDGLHDPYKNDTANDDNRLSILAFLLSDVFIFNSMHKFDNNDLEKIGFITMICKQLQKKDAQKTFPEFLLLLRDVAHVKLRNEKVEPMEYLQDVLQSSEDENDRFSAKWCIREHCQKKSCFKLTQPVEFEDLSELGQMNNPELKDRFLEDFRILKDHLFRDCDIKRLINDAPCATNAFCAFAVELVANVSDGVIPKVNSLQYKVADKENKRIWDETSAEFKTAMRDEKKSNLYERISMSMSAKFNALQRQGIERLNRCLVPVRDGCLDEFIQAFREFSKEEFLKVSAEKCRDFLMSHLEPYFNRIDDDGYKPPKAKEAFETHVQKVREKYIKERNLGPAKDNVLLEIERVIKKRAKELDLVDLRHQLHETDEANKEEKERLEQKIKKITKEIEEEKLEVERKIREHQLELKEKEFELEKKRLMDEQKLQQEKETLRSEYSKAISDLERQHTQLLEAGARQRENEREESVMSAFINGISLIGATTINALASERN